MWIFVTVAGGAGALARYWLSRWVTTAFAGFLPLRTLVVNVVGSLLPGFGMQAMRCLISSARRMVRAVVLAGVPALSSCVGAVSRSEVLSFLEALQRPFDLQDRTWLGILILTKEVVDLMIIALYQPVTWAYASGSVVDVLASGAGAYLGWWAGSRARNVSA